MKKLIGGMMALAFAVGCGAEDPAAVPANQETLQPEAQPGSNTLPEGYVETPLGRFHQSCVHEVPEGGEVDTDGTIRREGDVLRAPSACAFSSFRRGQEAGGETIGQDVARQSNALIRGWVAYVEASANNLGVLPPRFNGLENTLTIPSAPTVYAFQLIYLFSSLTPADGKAILQPVIQWGGSNGSKWMAAGWLVDRAGNAFHSPLVNVTAGEVIKGTIRDVYHSCVGTSCSWDVKILRGNTTISSLRVNSTETWSVAQKAVLEAYDVSSCRHLPTTNAIFLNTKAYEPYDPSNIDARIEIAGSLVWRKTVNAVSPACNFNAVSPNPQTGVIAWNPN